MGNDIRAKVLLLLGVLCAVTATVLGLAGIAAGEAKSTGLLIALGFMLASIAILLVRAGMKRNT